VVLWVVVPWVVLWLVLGVVPWPVASELAAPAAEVPVGVAVVPLAEVPVALEPELLDVVPDDELPVASLPEPLPVELQAARPKAIRLPIRRAWYFFMLTPL
jgi:hypothetical protein